MEKNILENSKIIKMKERAIIIGIMEIDMREIGKTEK